MSCDLLLQFDFAASLPVERELRAKGVGIFQMGWWEFGSTTCLFTGKLRERSLL